MKLTGKLKEKVSEAENKEQAKEAIKQAGMELTDDELEMVSGGIGDDYDNTKCQWNPNGNNHVFEHRSAGRMVCKYCGVHF